MMFRYSMHRSGRFGHPIVLAAFAVAAALPITAAIAQSTSARIFGQGPAGAKVEARNNNTGAHRSTIIRDDGRYDLRALSMGVYTVTLNSAGVVADTRRNIPLMVGRGAEVDFACPHDECSKAAPKSP